MAHSAALQLCHFATFPPLPMFIELTDQGYLHLSAELAKRYFPSDLLIALLRPPELWLLPTQGAQAGGLLLKQRNKQGDRSLLIWEVLPPNTPAGRRQAFWDEAKAALRVAL